MTGLHLTTAVVSVIVAAGTTSPVGVGGAGAGTVNASVVGGVGSATGATPSTWLPAATPLTSAVSRVISPDATPSTSIA